MKTRRLKIADIKIPEVRATAQYDDEQRAELARNLDSEGQLVPIVVAEHDGELILADGLNRIRDAMAKGEQYIDAVVREGSLEDVLVWNLATTYLKGSPLISEELEVIDALTNEFELDSIAIAKRTGMSQNRIEQLQWVGRAHPDVRAALDEGQIKLGHAAALARHLTPDQQATLLPHQLMNRWSIGTLMEYIQAVKEREGEIDQTEVAAPTVQVPNMMATCTSCGDAWLPGKLSAVLICPSCNGILADVVRNQQRAAAVGG